MDYFLSLVSVKKTSRMWLSDFQYMCQREMSVFSLFPRAPARAERIRPPPRIFKALCGVEGVSVQHKIILKGVQKWTCAMNLIHLPAVLT